MVLFDTIDIYIYIYIYTAIMLNWLSAACVGRTRKYCTLIFLSPVLLVRIPYSTFVIVTIEKAIVFIFIQFSPFAISFLYFN